MLLCMLATAWAGGQVNHTWHTLAARDALSPGPLADLVQREDLRPMLLHGSMFPDNGYGLGRHDYAEPAHWEQLHDPYLDWIVETYQPPWSDEAAQHIAFLLGMASHSLADTLFDAVFLERSKVHDAQGWVDTNVDLSTDVFFAAGVEPYELPPAWVPSEVLVELFADMGTEVDVDTLDEGQLRLMVAFAFVAAGGIDAEATAGHAALLPWAAEFMHDPDMAGNPRNVAPVVAAYWSSIWDRLHGRFTADGLVLASIPQRGSHDHIRQRDTPESWVYLTLARHVDAGTLDRVTVSDEEGREHPVAASLYYRQGNAIVLRPEEDWARDTTYTVTLDAGLAAADGTALEEPWTTTFSTAAAPEDTVAAPELDGCGCGSPASPGVWGSLLLAGLLGRRRAVRDRQTGRTG